MKLHLPTVLRRCLLATFASVLALTCAGTAKASVQHADVTIQTYTDFGQNRGRYVTGNSNALLQYINKDGVVLTYTGGEADYTLPHGMIDFGGQTDNGAAAAIGYNYIATVQHNGVQNPTFTGNDLASGNSIQYQGIEYRYGNSLLLTPEADYKITRLSKILTDVEGADVYSGSTSTEGQLLYRAGAGTMYKADSEGNKTYLLDAYRYITGGIDTIDEIPISYEDGSGFVYTYFDPSANGINETSPLPFMLMSGDSGSPAYLWNEATGQYEYYASCQGVEETSRVSLHVPATEWTQQTMGSFDSTVSMGDGLGTVYLNAIDTAGEQISDGWMANGSVNTVSTTAYSGAATDKNGTVLARYEGVQAGKHTWKDLSGLKDTQNWYTYGAGYLNASSTASDSCDLIYADLFNNNNLVLSASSSVPLQVVLRDTVDLGIGYVQFKPAAAGDEVEYVVRSEEGEAHLLNAAGFVVDKGATATLELTNPADYMREWRKVGEGTLIIAGSGNNDIFLNVGGSGTTRLEREGGYAAYNVLANSGSSVVLSGVSQIQRDFTFGYRGGVLDMNGSSMEWNNDNGAESDGFTIHALDEQAIITNGGSATTTLTWTQGGTQTWLGSFTDSESGALRFIYDGGADSSLTMHSIHTRLEHEASGIQVDSGTLVLAGTLTVHGTGSATGSNANRYSHADDWHYADASMDVTVADGATFELGSHARLTGDVSVSAGGCYLMREGVAHQMEYIEGGYSLEDTDSIRDYFGHKGNVSLQEGATMQVDFHAGTDSTLTYAGDITGAGALTVNAQEGVLRLSGNNSFSGSKEITSGGVHAASNAALGDTTSNQWLVGEQAWLASDDQAGAATLLGLIDSRSTGVLALSRDEASQLDLSGHQGLIIGAAQGCTVHYGTADAILEAVDGKWTLGGGGGELIVDFKLTGENSLVLGNASGQGNVHLSNTDNDFTGSIITTGGVTLSYDDGALGNTTVALGYGDRFLMQPSVIDNLTETSSGVLLVDSMDNKTADLSAHTGVALGASKDVVFSGDITLADGAAYRFGGLTGNLTVASALEAGRNIIIDGQGYSGGSIIFTQAGAFNGSVTIMGYDPSATTPALTEGTGTLSFATDNAMDSASSFTVEAGGVIDLAGTAQVLNEVTLNAGGTITDTSAERSGSVTFNGEGALNGTLNAAHAIKTGEGVLELGGTNSYERFDVQGGTLKLTAATATASKGEIVLSNGATLDTNGQTPGGSILVSGTGKITTTSSNAAISGAVTVEKDSTLQVLNNSGTFSASLNGEGTVEFTPGAGKLITISGSNTNFKGALLISGSGINSNSTNNGVKFNIWSQLGSGSVTINGAYFYLNSVNNASTAVQATLNIGSGGALLNGGSGNAYYFTSLAGSGTFYSYLGSNANGKAASANFCGDLRGFTGQFDSNRNGSGNFIFRFGGTAADYHQLTGSAGSDALALFGSASTVTMGSTTGRIQQNYEFCYADDVILNAKATGQANVTQAGTGTLVLNQANDSTGTLTINDGGTVELANGGSWTGALAGAGTLVNSNAGSAISVSSATSFSGSLELMRGSNLSLGTSGAYTLASGTHLAVFGAADNGAALTAGTLTLNGGTLIFRADSLSEGDTATLNLSGITTLSFASELTQTVTLTDTSALAAGSYLLASGDWSALDAEKVVLSGLDDYFTSSVSTDADGLHLTLALADKTFNWAGTESSHAWSDVSFGSVGTLPGTDDTVLFTDAAENRNVNITGDVKAGALVINSTLGYELAASGEGSLEAASLELRQGTAELGEGISITTATSLASGTELTVQNFSTLHGTVSGEGTLHVAAGDLSGRMDANLSGLSTLRISSGRYEAKEDTGVSSIMVEGGQFFANGGTYASNITLAGSGWSASSAEHADAALRAEGATFSGTISLAGDTSMSLTGTAASTLNNSLSTGDATLTIQGGGTLTLNTASVSGNLAVTNGTTLILKKDIYSGLNSLSLGAGAVAQLNGTDLTAPSLRMKEGASLMLTRAAQGTSMVESAITVEGNATAGGSITQGSAVIMGSISGSGCMALTIAGNAWTLKSDLTDGQGGQLSLRTNSNLEIDNANTYSGGTVIEGGTLTMAQATALGSGSIELKGGTLNLNGKEVSNTISVTSASNLKGSSAYTGQLVLDGGTLTGDAITLAKDASLLSGSVANVLTGSAGVVKSGEGTATLSGANTYTGATQVTGGTLILIGSVAGDISVSSGATLQATNPQLAAGTQLTLADGSTLEGDFTTAADTVLSAGAGASIIGALTLDGGALILADIAKGGISAGSLILGSNDTMLTVGDISTLTTGNYALISSTGTPTQSSLDSLKLELKGNLGIRNTYELALKDNTLQLVVGDYTADLDWDPDNSTWSAGSTGDSWDSGDDSTQSFVQGDRVTFSEGGTVVLEGELLPGSVTVSGDENTTTTFNGEGSIAGETTLTKSGEGELIINTTNSYSGDTIVQDGTLTVGNAAALGSSDVTLEGGTLNLGDKKVANDITATDEATLNGASAYTGQLTLNGGTLTGDAINLAQDAILVSGSIANKLSGAEGVVKSGTDTVTLSGTNTYSGGTVVQEGTLVAGHDSAFGSGEVTVAGGSLDLSSTAVANSILVTGAAALNGASAYAGQLVVNAAADTDTLTGDAIKLTQDATLQQGTIDNVLTGTGGIVKSGEGTVTLTAANSYSGGTVVQEGTLVAGHDSAFGSGEVTLMGGTLDLNGHNVTNAISISGQNATLAGAQNLTDIVLNSGSSTQTDANGIVLSSGRTLTVAGQGDAATLNGALTLGGGTLTLSGSTLAASATTIQDGTTTTIDLSGWEGLSREEETVLAQLGTVTGNVDGLALYGIDASLAPYATLAMDDSGTLYLTYVPTENPEMARGLTSNQRSVYSALCAIARAGNATGALANTAWDAGTAVDANALKAILDDVSGEEYATMMSSQIEGNLAHLRRLRAHMGHGDMLAGSKSGLAAYVNGFSELADVDADSRGQGYRRSEWGAEIGIEQEITEGMGIGLAFSMGRANITPTSGARYHEESQMLDVYHMARFGAWENRLSLGVGFHEHDLRRTLASGGMGNARGVDGTSFNFMEEISCHIPVTDSVTLRPFLAVESSVNDIDGFVEGGNGTLSLVGASQDAWATDITLGVSCETRFTVLADAPSASFSVHAGVTASVGDTTDDLRLSFAGAPGYSFEQRSADRDRWGVNLGAGLTVPVTRFTSLYATAETVLRGDSTSVDAQLGVRMNF